MNLEQKTIKRLKYFKNKNYKIKVGFSGGKDSVVLYNLIKKSGLDVDFVYQNTTIDPPGTLSYIRENFPDVKIENPEKSFFKLVEKKGLPNRIMRWCCAFLKENNNKGYDIIIIGVRRVESYKRSDRKIIEKYKNEIHFNPIIDWTDKDIWDFIAKYNIKLIKYYYPPYNFKRHGCVMCPLASKKQQQKEAILFPKYLKALLRAVKKYREIHKNSDFVKTFKDEYEMVYLWLHQKLNKLGKEQITNNIFEFNAKQILDDFIKSKHIDNQRLT